MNSSATSFRGLAVEHSLGQDDHGGNHHQQDGKVQPLLEGQFFRKGGRENHNQLKPKSAWMPAGSCGFRPVPGRLPCQR